MANWPDGDARYEFPGGVTDARKRWQNAVDEALAGGSLQLVPVSADVYDLIGKCPRCDHETGQSIDFGVILPYSGPGVESSPIATFDIVCSCTEPHTGRQPGKVGCGWGRGLPLSLTVPDGS
ncbi:MAG: hypothetical protein LC808_03570 [Actinobacteria bacterium]|nr:hypothetical protein [Actinomycetota bacterium]